MRCRRNLDPQRFPVTPAGIVGATVAAVIQLIRRDYARTIGDARTMTAAPRHWFRGTTVPTMAQDTFLQRWGFNGVICSVTPANAEGQGSRLQIHLSSTTPVGLQHASQTAEHGDSAGAGGPS